MMTTMKDKDLLKLLIQNGRILMNIKGSHYRLKKGNQIEIIPVHGKDMKIGLLTAILKRTGIQK